MPNAPLSPDTRAILAAIERVNADTQVQIIALTQEVERLKDAFPDSDPAGHRLYHERLIAKHDRWAEARHKLLMHIAGWGSLGLFGWLAALVWEAIKMETKK